jgi:hypothetical protein
MAFRQIPVSLKNPYPEFMASEAGTTLTGGAVARIEFNDSIPDQASVSIAVGNAILRIMSELS